MIDIYKDISFTVFFDTDINKLLELFNNRLNGAFKTNNQFNKVGIVDFDLIYTNASILKYQGYLYQNNNNTIYFDNTGESYYAVVWNICTKNNIKAVLFSLSSIDAEYPGYIMNYFDKGKERVVQCYNDGGRWVFYTKGEVQHFEDETYYKERIKKKKFNREIIINYCKKMGLDIEYKEFWLPKKDIYCYTR